MKCRRRVSACWPRSIIGRLCAMPALTSPGTIVIDNGKRQLFLILEDGHALRYGISVRA